MFKRLLLIILVVILLTLSCSRPADPVRLFAGGFTKDNEKGLSLFEMDSKGNLELISETDAGPSPSFFCFNKRYNLIYALDEVMEFHGKPGGGITTLKYDVSDGAIEKLNEISVPYGGPCHISISADSGFLFVASYSSASVAVVKLGKDGIPERISDSILYVTEAPKVSHPHMISQDPTGKFVYLADLGLNRLVVFIFACKEGRLFQVENGIIDLPPGTGPRHFTFSGDGSSMYIINELGSTVMHFTVGDDGLPVLKQIITTTGEGFAGKNFCAEIILDQNEKFLYGSNRGENSIVVFSVGEDGYLTQAGRTPCGGDWPRNFTIDPSGRFLLSGNQRSNYISVFRINPKNGLPEVPVSKTEMKAPAYLKFWQ